MRRGAACESAPVSTAAENPSEVGALGLPGASLLMCGAGGVGRTGEWITGWPRRNGRASEESPTALLPKPPRCARPSCQNPPAVRVLMAGIAHGGWVLTCSRVHSGMVLARMAVDAGRANSVKEIPGAWAFICVERLLDALPSLSLRLHAAAVGECPKVACKPCPRLVRFQNQWHPVICRRLSKSHIHPLLSAGLSFSPQSCEALARPFSPRGCDGGRPVPP